MSSSLIESFDQVTVFPQGMINSLIRQCSPPPGQDNKLRVMSRSGNGFSNLVPGVPRLIVDIEGNSPDRVFLQLPLVSGSLKVWQDNNPSNETWIEYHVEDWCLALPVRLNGKTGATQLPESLLTPMAQKRRKEYLNLHGQLKQAGREVLIWDWLMQIGVGNFQPVDARYSSFGRWTDRDYYVSEDVREPATKRFAAGSPRNWPVDDNPWFQRFSECLQELGQELWQSITFDLFKGVAATIVVAPPHSPSSPPATKGRRLFIQPRASANMGSDLNSLCFLEADGDDTEGKRIAALDRLTVGQGLLSVQLRADRIVETWLAPVLNAYNALFRACFGAPKNIHDAISESQRGGYSFKRCQDLFDFTRAAPFYFNTPPLDALIWTFNKMDEWRHESVRREMTTFTKLSIRPGTAQMHVEVRYYDHYACDSSPLLPIVLPSTLFTGGTMVFTFKDTDQGLCLTAEHLWEAVVEFVKPFSHHESNVPLIQQQLEKLQKMTEQLPFITFPLNKHIPGMQGKLVTKNLRFTAEGCLAWELALPEN